MSFIFEEGTYRAFVKTNFKKGSSLNENINSNIYPFNSNIKFDLLWVHKNWNDLNIFYGLRVWTDNNNIYYSNGSQQYELNKNTDTWIPKYWDGFNTIYGEYIWKDNDNNIYYSYSNDQYKLNNNIWTPVSWGNYQDIYGIDIWKD